MFGYRNHSNKTFLKFSDAALHGFETLITKQPMTQCADSLCHPLRQSEHSPLSGHVRKVQTFPLYTGLLARAVYPPPSPSRRSGASPAVVMTLCEKEKKRTADPNERTDCPACLEDGEARKSSMDITDKTAIPGGGKSKRQWMTCPGMYKVSVVARTSVRSRSCPY